MIEASWLQLDLPFVIETKGLFQVGNEREGVWIFHPRDNKLLKRFTL